MSWTKTISIAAVSTGHHASRHLDGPPVPATITARLRLQTGLSDEELRRRKAEFEKSFPGGLVTRVRIQTLK